MLHIFDIQAIISSYGYLGIFLIIFFESGIFPPLPGDSLLFAAGLFAAIGGFNLYLLLFIVFVASFLGIISGYYVGVHLKKLDKYTFFNRILKEEYIEKAEIFFADHGKMAIILSRFVPIVRTFVPITAGAAHMEYKSFLKYSLIGSILWSGVFILSGFFLGKVFPQIQDYFLWIIIGVIVFSLLPGVYHWLKNRK